MKYAASMPALSTMDQRTGGTGSPFRAEKAHLLKRAMTLSNLQRSNQGMEIRREIFNTPFVAMPGTFLFACHRHCHCRVIHESHKYVVYDGAMNRRGLEPSYHVAYLLS
jgi:hypothetical protein